LSNNINFGEVEFGDSESDSPCCVVVSFMIGSGCGMIECNEADGAVASGTSGDAIHPLDISCCHGLKFTGNRREITQRKTRKHVALPMM